MSRLSSSTSTTALRQLSRSTLFHHNHALQIMPTQHQLPIRLFTSLFSRPTLSNTQLAHSNTTTPSSTPPTRTSTAASVSSADTGKGSVANLFANIRSGEPLEGTITVSIDGAVYNVAPRDPNHAWTLPHAQWNDIYVQQVKYTHFVNKDWMDTLALYTIKTIRFNFDWMSGYVFGTLTPYKAITRIVFLETVAGIPGSIGSILRHLASLRRMKRDGGWIQTLMQEAENERMHLLTALEVQQPGPAMKACVWVTQGIFFNFFWTAYLISPKFCHRLVGYLEEEAVVTYTHILNEIDRPNSPLSVWKTTPAPPFAIAYWGLHPQATLRDVMAHIRADEAHHRDVNHRLAGLNKDDLNPYRNEV